jgi:hypothetical protein
MKPSGLALVAGMVSASAVGASIGYAIVFVFLPTDEVFQEIAVTTISLSWMGAMVLWTLEGGRAVIECAEETKTE